MAAPTVCQPFGGMIFRRIRPSVGRVELREAIAANVRSLRAHKNWKQEDLAERLNSNQRAVSRLESGQRGDVGIAELRDLCAVFGVTLVKLLDGANPADLRTLGL